MSDTVGAKKSYDSIIFDLDGTLWDAVDNILISWNKVLNSHKELDIVLTKNELTQCMGLKMDSIAKKLFPELSVREQMTLMEECSSYEIEYLSEYGAKLYDRVEETLKKLSQHCKLFICSNCQKGYIECFIKHFSFEKYFTDIECWGNTGLSKGENNKLLIKRNSLVSPVYVGDTQGDMLSAKEANIPFIYARYGFGQCTEYNYVIDSFGELAEIFL